MAGRILTRFLKSAQDNQVVEQLNPLKTEVAFIRGMLLRAGERIPLACEYLPELRLGFNLVFLQTATGRC